MYLFLFCVYSCFACMYVHVLHACLVYEESEESTGFLGLGLRTVRSPSVGAGK